ncbi:hypothetical protein HYT24_02290 [Candidatus Pacearchaeota archaeon]|nr:hypothetical protein [Candidatus Pacearchaeota archaeon]
MEDLDNLVILAGSVMTAVALTGFAFERFVERIVWHPEKDEDIAYQIFLQKGVEYTEGFLNGRKGRLSNFFNSEYKAARKAIDKLTNGSYSENEVLRSGRFFQG